MDSGIQRSDASGAGNEPAYSGGSSALGETSRLDGALQMLGWDLVSVQHVTTIPECLFAELRKFRTFQAARYTLAVAAVLARAGYRIALPDADRRDQNRVDVLATPPRWGLPFAVEAKSRRRAGVLHAREGGSGSDADWVRSRLRAANDQLPPGYPLFVFLDINSPAPADAREIDEGLRREEKGEPRDYSVVAVTCLRPYYARQKEPPPGNFFAGWAAPHLTRYPLGEEICNDVFDSIKLYGKDIPKELGSDEPR